MRSHLVALVALVALACAPALVAQQTSAAPAARKPILGGAPRVAPDGSRILFSSDRSGKTQLYTMRVDGTDLRQLTTDSAGAHSAAWSPDVRRVVYVTSGAIGNRIVIIGADGSGRRVISEAAGNQSPSWSPDGSSILFAAGEFPNINIHTMNADGNNRRNIAPNPGFDYDAAWSPDGKSIAFVNAVRGQGPRVYMMNADGSGRRRLTVTDDAEERPAWSLDGKSIAFQASNRTAAGVPEAHIYITELASGTTRRVTTHNRPVLDETPSWFPDGKRLAIQSDRDGTWSVYVIDTSKPGLTRLTKPAYYYNPAWSPDGRTITFESTRDGKSAVYRIGIDGMRLTKLTTDGANSERPAWSPDGRRIVFSSDRDGHGELYVMSADGSSQTRLTRTSGGGKYQSSYSPDGQWIVFQGRPDNALVSEHVYIMRSDGSGVRELSDSTANSEGPRWLPDGRITFTQSRYTVRLWSEMTPPEMERAKRGEEVVTVRPDGSGLTRVAKSADTSRANNGAPVPDAVISPDGRLYAFTRDSGDAFGVYIYDIAARRERLLIGGMTPP